MTSNPHFEGNCNLYYCDKNQKSIIYPAAHNIVWGNDGRYWKPINQSHPIYSKLIKSNVQPKNEEVPPAELIQVNWLEVTGSIKVSPGRRYKVEFLVSLAPDAFGWGNSPLYLMAKTHRCSKPLIIWKKCSLSSMVADRKMYIPANLVIDSGDASQLQFGLYEVWTGKWKGGLRIHHVLVQPYKESENY